MTRTSILIGAGVFVGVVILGLAAIVSFLTLNDGPDERDRGSSESARRADRPESRIAGEPTVAPGAHVERGVPGDTGGQAEQEVRLVGIVPSPRIVRLDTPGDWHQLTVHGYYSDRSQSELDGYYSDRSQSELDDDARFRTPRPSHPWFRWMTVEW